MNNADISLQNLIEILNKSNADILKYSFDIEKDGEKYFFKCFIKRVEEDGDE